MAEQTQAIYLQQGKTQPLVLRCETEPIIYKPISGISLEHGAPRLEVLGHGLVNGWRAACTRVVGMKQINAEIDPVTLLPKDDGYHQVTVIDGDNIEFNGLVPVDDNGREWPAYMSGGHLQYNTPLDLTGLKARLQIRNKKNGDVIHLEMTDDNGLIEIDAALKTIFLYFDALDLTNQTWKKGYFELELYKNTVRGALTIPFVYSPIEGPITLDVETTK